MFLCHLLIFQRNSISKIRKKILTGGLSNVLITYDCSIFWRLATVKESGLSQLLKFQEPNHTSAHSFVPLHFHGYTKANFSLSIDGWFFTIFSIYLSGFLSLLWKIFSFCRCFCVRFIFSFFLPSYSFLSFCYFRSPLVVHISAQFHVQVNFTLSNDFTVIAFFLNCSKTYFLLMSNYFWCLSFYSPPYGCCQNV